MAGPGLGGPMGGPAPAGPGMSDDDAVIEMLGQALKILVEKKMGGGAAPAPAGLGPMLG